MLKTCYNRNVFYGMEMTGGTPRKGYGMNEQGARPAATAGVMTAAAVVYALAAIYLPMLTMVLGLLWPVFVALVVVRVGLKWGVLMTAASLLLLMLFATPVMGAFFVLAFAPTGLVLGALVRRDRSAVQTLFAGAAASLGGKVMGAALMFALFGLNPLMIDAADMTAALDRTIEIYRSLGIAETEITELRAAGEQMLTLFVQMLPALLIVSALAEAALSLTILQRVLRRMGIASRALPSFTMWRFPVFFPYLFGFAIVGLYWGSTRDVTLLYEAALNAYLISFFAGLIQGLSLMHFMMTRFEVAPFVRTLLYVFVAINGLVTQVVSWTGLFDMVYDYRKKLGIDKQNIQ
ncbi:hypothetical protein HMPREF9555_02173 [Selenomonas artemidis F0399]|uniref:DUF2232 domain-containing protein n=2 Tax=Selenomonas TaxID=970 RepID=E7N578_9FIRM|nr:hypothetical protein HMPREF9555_02173 [Selenomonas artemidis F0399]